MLFYLSGASIYGLFLFIKLINDEDCPNTNSASWIVISIASALWLIAIPISLWELTIKAQAKKEPKSQSLRTLNFEEPAPTNIDPSIVT